MLNNKNGLLKTFDAFDDNKPIMVSVIVNTFNHEKYVAEALESILNQKVNFNIEILVHDDCSKDGTVRILRIFEEKYPHLFKIIYESENQFSKGIEIDAAYNYPRIKGKYVAMLEGDDKWIDEYKLFKQVSYLEKHPKLSAYIARTIKFNMRDNKYGYYGLANDRCSKKYKLKDLIKGKDFSVSSFLARKEFFVPPFPEFINIFVGFTDIQLGYYFALHHYIYYDSHPLSLYRQYSSPSSFTSTFSNLDKDKKLQTYENRIKVLELLQKEVNKKDLKVLKKRIKQEKFTLLVIRNDIETLTSKEYIKMYKRKLRHDAIKRFLHISK